MGLERIVLPVGLVLALAGGISSLVIPSAQAQNVPEVRDRRDSNDSTRSTVSQEDTSRIAQEYNVPIEEVYRVDRELHQPVEETLRGLPIVKVGDWDDFARVHPFEYDNITAQNFPQFLNLYQQFIDQIAPAYWREVRQENTPVDERKPVISFFWDTSNDTTSRGSASLIRTLGEEYQQKIRFVGLNSYTDSIYPSQIHILEAKFEVQSMPTIIIYKPDNNGIISRVERMSGGIDFVNSVLKNRRIFKEYIIEQVLR